MASTTERRLGDLVSVGPATLEDFDRLGIGSVDDLARQDARELYERLGRLLGVRLDVCCLDVFECAIAQARDTDLPAERRNWWWWSRRRKAEARGART